MTNNHQPVKNHSVIFDIFLTLISFGLWNFYVQFRQIEDLNYHLDRDEYAQIAKIFLLTILTLGIYFIYHEYRMCKDIHLLVYNESRTGLNVLMGVLTFFGLWFIVDSYQQSLLNKYIAPTNSKGLPLP